MCAAVLKTPGRIEIEDRAIPQPKPDEVLVRVRSVGICGSDAHYYQHGRIGRYVVTQPLILGHECSGEIVEVGSEVAGERIGERVAVEPGIPCRRCGYCKSGRYNLCPRMVFLATPPVDGGLAEYLAVPSDFAHPIPDHVSLEEAALVEPTAVAVHGARLGAVGPGMACLVFGAGPVGLLILQVARAFGASSVAVVDPIESRLRLAHELGADLTVNPTSGNLATSLDGYSQSGIDVVFDASGSQAALTSSIEVVRPGGRIVWIGLPARDTVPISAATLIDKEVELRGVFRYANAHPLAIELISKGSLRVATLISHRFPLERANDALNLVAGRDAGVVKALVEP